MTAEQRRRLVIFRLSESEPPYRRGIFMPNAPISATPRRHHLSDQALSIDGFGVHFSINRWRSLSRNSLASPLLAGSDAL